MATTIPHDLSWLLTDFVERTDGAISALVTSRDGMTISSLNFEGDGTADTLSAIASGLHSLSLGVVKQLGGTGGMRQVVIELDEGHLFVMAAGEGALLTVLVDSGAEVGQVAFEMTLLVKRVPHFLSVAPRSEPATADSTV